MKSFKILPTFFQKGDQKVDGHIKVSSDIILRHLDSSNSSTQTENFFQLESKLMDYLTVYLTS